MLCHPKTRPNELFPTIEGHILDKGYNLGPNSIKTSSSQNIRRRTTLTFNRIIHFC